MAFLEQQGDRYDANCLLQPTNPLRSAAMIDACIERFVAAGADSLISVLPVPAEHNPHWVYFDAPDGTLRLSTASPRPSRAARSCRQRGPARARST